MRNHYAERLELLEKLAGKLTMANVPKRIKEHAPSVAPSDPRERTMPVLYVGPYGQELCRVRVLYWRSLENPDVSLPFFVIFDSFTRWSTDDAGMDQVASLIALSWHDKRARAEPEDNRDM